MNIENLITHIKKRPKMFIPSLEINELYFFISGFLVAKKTNNIMEEVDILFDKEFNNWLIKKLNHKNKNSNWYDIIEENIFENKFSTTIDFFTEWFSEQSGNIPNLEM